MPVFLLIAGLTMMAVGIGLAMRGPMKGARPAGLTKKASESKVESKVEPKVEVKEE